MATKTTNDLAYWMDGTAYCAECVESESPCLSETEREQATREAGTGRCGCCGRDFSAVEVQ